ncbi:response regulator transcription factor [Sphingomonas sp. JC676]|uniref:LuxR C-terminal-related transcriptional regulator n=1 Tax=Sphingomonas sp. JC676 TaxID=2768065 RepID=UPI001657E9A6|nr:response regulator transcription factor [Sphingomonas sp. JC676]MBC9031372.1 response regulator transcription factor [Sphingomonas sp. JC676]
MSDLMHVSILGKSEIIREGLRRILIDQGFVVDAAESNYCDFGQLDCDVIIVDTHSLDDGLQSCRELRERYPNSRIVLMMDQYYIEDVAHAFASGAVDGYLVKAISCAPLAGALRLIAMGEKVLPSEVAESLTHSIPQIMWSGRETGLTGLPLSNREIEILRCLLDGDPNKVISRRLGIADATVKVHIKAILRKLRVQNRTQAAIWAANRGLTLSTATDPVQLVAASA